METWGPAARQVPPGRNLLTCILLRILSSRCSWRTHHNQDHGALLPLLMPTQNHFISYLKPDCVPLSLPTRALSSVLACTSGMLDMRAVCPSSGDYYTPPPTQSPPGSPLPWHFQISCGPATPPPRHRLASPSLSLPGLFF